MSDSRRKRSRFVKEGGFLFGARILKVTKKELTVKLPDGKQQKLILDEFFTITPGRKK